MPVAELQAVGRVSYCGYLFHIPAVNVARYVLAHFRDLRQRTALGASHAALFLCAFPLTVATAWLSFGFFEQRFSRMGWRRT
jgi:peptidoglycan/LPS O-acetylase OafA/YrhL